MIWVLVFTVLLGQSTATITAEFGSLAACKAASVWAVSLPGTDKANCSVKELRGV